MSAFHLWIQKILNIVCHCNIFKRCNHRPITQREEVLVCYQSVLRHVFSLLCSYVMFSPSVMSSGLTNGWAVWEVLPISLQVYEKNLSQKLWLINLVQYLNELYSCHEKNILQYRRLLLEVHIIWQLKQLAFSFAVI